MADNLLAVRNLVKSFGVVVPNDDISIDIPRGMLAGLIGPNGSGKTSLFNDFTMPARAIDERATGMLDFVGLHEKRDTAAGELSFGQCKLLEFGMALMCAPKLLLLDEPTAGIHPRLIDTMVERLQRANAEFGITLLVIEHNMEVIMNLAEQIYCLDNGRVLAYGTPREISSDQRVIDAYLGAHA